MIDVLDLGNSDIAKSGSIAYCNSTGPRDTVFNNEYSWNTTFVREIKVNNKALATESLMKSQNETLNSP